MRAPTQARRDAILCAIRDGSLVSTIEIFRAICTICAGPGRSSHYHCYSTVYAGLRALDRIGMVHWEPSTGMTPAMWMLTIKAREQFETTDIESIWAIPS